jgi:hypothetical protein
MFAKECVPNSTVGAGGVGLSIFHKAGDAMLVRPMASRPGGAHCRPIRSGGLGKYSRPPSTGLRRNCFDPPPRPMRRQARRVSAVQATGSLPDFYHYP